MSGPPAPDSEKFKGLLKQVIRRVAQAFEFAGTNKAEGAPSFAQFAKGGNHERLSNGICAEGKSRCRQHHDPPLQRTQGRGTLYVEGAHEDHEKGGPPARKPHINNPYREAWHLLNQPAPPRIRIANVERAPPPAALDVDVDVAVVRVGRTLLSDAFDVDLDFALDLALDLDREGHGLSRAENRPPKAATDGAASS